MASQITSLTIVYSTVDLGVDHRKHQSSASLAFELGIHRWPVNSPHKGPVMRKMFPFEDVIMDAGNIWCVYYHRNSLGSNINTVVIVRHTTNSTCAVLRNNNLHSTCCFCNENSILCKVAKLATDKQWFQRNAIMIPCLRNCNWHVIALWRNIIMEQ